MPISLAQVRLVIGVALLLGLLAASAPEAGALPIPKVPPPKVGKGPIPPVQLPPVQLPPGLPVPWPNVIVGPGGAAMKEPTGTPLERARKALFQVRRSLADRDKLNLKASDAQARYAEAIVEHEYKVARSNGFARRETRLAAVLEDIRSARRHIAAHRIDSAVAALTEGFEGLQVITEGKKARPKK